MNTFEVTSTSGNPDNPVTSEDPFGTLKDHKRADELVIDQLGGLIKTSNIEPDSFYIPYLLLAIIQDLGGVIKRDSALDYLLKHEELRKMLSRTWLEKSFQEVRNFIITGIIGQDKQARLSAVIPGSLNMAKIKKKMLIAMKAPYKGIAVKALYEYLEWNNKKFHESLAMESGEKYYAKFCSMVQSSGSGKTHTILKLADEHVLLLYINLEPVGDTSFPCKDPIPARLLIPKWNQTEKEYFVTCCTFFAAIFKHVKEIFTKEAGKSKNKVIDDWNKCSCDFNPQNHEAFFLKLEKTQSEILTEVQTQAATQDVIEVATKKMYAIGKEMAAYLYPESADDYTPKLVIALDEGHPLNSVVNVMSKTYHPATVLCRVIKCFSSDECGRVVWVLFASTTSKVSHFAAPQHLSNSTRIYQHGEILFPPFTALGWDHQAPALHSVPFFDVAKAKHLICYGRPLWYSVHEMYSLSEMREFALSKLLGLGTQTNEKYKSLAILGQRFCLDVCFGHREAILYVESSVASHLQVCITTSEDRYWSYTTYPSEPLLSCIAAYALHQSKKVLTDTLNILWEKVDEGMVEVGKGGELVSRLLWLIAKDMFVIRRNHTMWAQNSEGKEDSDEYEHELIHCQMIPVVPFFEFVFGTTFWPSTDTQKVFENAYINFSHWISMSSNIQRNPGSSAADLEEEIALDEWTLRLWNRTSAVQCCHGQPLIDKVIPMYFKPDANSNQNSGVSHILISDKACTHSQPKALKIIDRDDPSISGRNGKTGNTLPYIAILADLAVEPADGSVEVTFRPEKPPSRKYENGLASSLRIHAKGIGENPYAFLKEHSDILQLLKNLINKETIPSVSDMPTYQKVRNEYLLAQSSKITDMRWEKESSSHQETMSLHSRKRRREN